MTTTVRLHVKILTTKVALLARSKFIQIVHGFRAKKETRIICEISFFSIFLQQLSFKFLLLGVLAFGYSHVYVHFFELPDANKCIVYIYILTWGGTRL